MMAFSDLPIRRPVAVLMLLISLLVLGAVSIPRLPLDFMPLVERPFITVVVPFPGSHPLESLRKVVEPLEEELATISEVESITAQAVPGEAQVTVRFSWSTNLDLKKMEVREAVDRARNELPDEINDIFVRTFQDGPSDGALIEGRISATRDLSESYDLLDRKIRRPLERIQGVASVRLDGVSPQQVRIEVDPLALVRHGVDPQAVLQKLQAANVDTDLGAIHGDLLRYDVRSLGRFRNLDEIRNLTLDADGSLRIRDVAKVSLREPRPDYGRHLDREFAIGVQVFREPTANTVAVSDAVMERIEAITRDPELEGISLLVWMNQGEEIRNSLLALRNAGLFGGLLAVGVLFVFLRRLSTTLIVAAAIPFSIVVACGVMYLTGMVLNVLTMLGLMVGVGMLVDNAVVVIENIHRLQQRGMAPREAARVGAREVTLAVIAATATTLIVWSWLFTIEPNEMYIYIGAVAFTLCIAVACSLLISLTFIPLAAARFVPHREVRPGWIMRRLVPVYRRLLGWTLAHRMLGLMGLVLLAGSAAIPITLIEKTGQPRQREREVSIFYRAHDPITWEAFEMHVNQVEEWLASRRDELGYERLYSFYNDTGFAMTRIYPPAQGLNDAVLNDLREKLRDKLPVIAGVRLEIGDRNRMRHGRGNRNMVPLALHGEDPEYLRQVALEVEALLRGVAGVRDVFGPSISGSQEARVMVDPRRAADLGLTPRQVANVVAFTYRGRSLQRYQGPRGEVEMLLGLDEDLQPGLASLASLPIPTADNRIVPLGSVARVTMGRTEREIEREDRKTSQWVNAEFVDGVTTEEGKERIAAVMRGFALPEGYSWDWGRWGRDRDSTLGIMFQGILLSLVLVFLLMAALFESILQPLAIFITLPLAFFGAFWALWLLGYKLEVVAFIGVIILIGMVVNNGIVMVDHVNKLRREGQARVPALIEGCGDRLRPILMTTITTIFGLLPLVLSRFTVAGIYVESMAVVIMGGLASSTIFTLIALPLWYSTVEDVGSVMGRALPHLRRRPATAVDSDLIS
ncbi:MAG: efflux RND transporter permease subunit [Acidobacteria bacterium]|nr:efflux RND transporter permease subunit [Acidobacteriota bacterium]